MREIKISVFDEHKTDAKQTEWVDEEVSVTFPELPKIICQRMWTGGTFHQTEGTTKFLPGVKLFKRWRNKDNFKQTELMVLDVDEGASINEALVRLKEISLEALVLTTKSHQHDKHGVICDRFRILLFLERPIQNNDTFLATWFQAQKLFPYIDKSCKNSDRLWFPSRELVAHIGGKPFPVAQPQPAKIQKRQPLPTQKGDFDFRPDGRGIEPFKRTKMFILYGAPDGQFHNELVYACNNLKQQLWTEEEAINVLRTAATNAERELDDHDLKTIQDIFRNPNRKVHPPRLPVDVYEAQDAPSNSDIPSTEELRVQRQRERELRKLAKEKSIPLPFMYHARFGEYALVVGTTLIGGVSHHGKSTLVANILATIIENCPNTQVLVLLNEESSDIMYSRVACILLGKNFDDFEDERLSEEEVKEIDDVIDQRIIPQIKIMEQINSLEALAGVLTAAEGKSDLVILDYLQLINRSEKNKLKPFEVSQAIGNLVAGYSTRSSTRVLVFAQLRPDGRSDTHFAQRVQNDTHFFNHMDAAIELVRDPNTPGLTDFIIHKNRYGRWKAGTEVSAKFENGRFKRIEQRDLDQVGIQASNSFMPTDEEASQSDDVPF